MNSFDSQSGAINVAVRYTENVIGLQVALNCSVSSAKWKNAFYGGVVFAFKLSEGVFR